MESTTTLAPSAPLVEAVTPDLPAPVASTQPNALLIVERASVVNSFFVTYPHSRRLASMFTPHDDGCCFEQNLRWDWNSLLPPDGQEPAVLFEQFSRERFAHADASVAHAAAWARHYGVYQHILFRTTV